MLDVAPIKSRSAAAEVRAAEDVNVQDLVAPLKVMLSVMLILLPLRLKLTEPTLKALSALFTAWTNRSLAVFVPAKILTMPSNRMLLMALPLVAVSEKASTPPDVE